MKLRIFHRILGLWLFIFVINAAATGAMRANAKWWYFKDRPSRMEAISLAPPQITITEAIKVYQNRFPGEKIHLVQLKSVLDQAVYQVESKQGQKKRLLVSASSGEILSPIKEELALKIARSYVADTESILSVQQFAAFKARKNLEARPVIKVSFNDSRKTEVFIDQETADVLNVLDSGRRLGLWVNKLHELDFLGMSRLALTILGVGIIFLSVAGIFLRWTTRRTKKGRQEPYV